MNFAESGGSRVVNRGRGADADRGRLVGCGKKPGRPVRRAVGRQPSRVGQHDEHGQILVQTAQRIGNPATGARETGQDEPGILHERRRPVNIRFRDQRSDERDVVNARSRVRKQVADPLAALSVLLPTPRARHHHARIALKQLHLFARIPLFAGVLDQPRLVIEQCRTGWRLRT